MADPGIRLDVDSVTIRQGGGPEQEFASRCRVAAGR